MQENRDGYATTGSYSVALPDGRTQTVNYHTNGDSGNIAEVGIHYGIFDTLQFKDNRGSRSASAFETVLNEAYMYLPKYFSC